MSESLSLNVNGTATTVPSSCAGESLLWVLREILELRSAKGACEEGECGSCTVLVDQRPVCSCLTMTGVLGDTEVVTLEGLEDDPMTSAVQRALVATGGVQCGFCTPGFVVAIRSLIDETEALTASAVREALSGNLCRCTGYGRILEAVALAAREYHGAELEPR
ncbi:(2Fe-2S)-binding protein [Candidatus Poriferisocius sp.]|uniref:(2Fe-2S)-binding protein n=1 Tax=Candidatus Poriferisocius sp. TaxID=3101276 RepID=UPI003B01FC71